MGTFFFLVFPVLKVQTKNEELHLFCDSVLQLSFGHLKPLDFNPIHGFICGEQKSGAFKEG